MISDAIAIAGGAVVAVFVGGVLIEQVLGRLPVGAGGPPVDDASLKGAGRYIGWLERALLFALIVAGAPGAGALVVALKSVARFPSFSEARFAEYFLIGTLASVLVATLSAFAVRALLGLPVLAP